MNNFCVAKAHVRHAQGIHKLLTTFSEQALLLPRPVSEVYRLIPQFFVIEQGDRVIGCAALEVFSESLGEVRSLAVDPDYQGQHIGEKLLDKIEDYASQLGLTKMMALTYVEKFFHQYGYNTVEMHTLPEKVWRVCVKCPNFHHCDEIPVVKHL